MKQFQKNEKVKWRGATGIQRHGFYHSPAKRNYANEPAHWVILSTDVEDVKESEKVNSQDYWLVLDLKLMRDV